jgi:hypothetical protein
MRRRGVVWDREGDEGTELGKLYRGKGWEGGRDGRKERRKEGIKEGGRR